MFLLHYIIYTNNYEQATKNDRTIKRVKFPHFAKNGLFSASTSICYLLATLWCRSISNFWFSNYGI